MFEKGSMVLNAVERSGESRTNVDMCVCGGGGLLNPLQIESIYFIVE